ncbi:unnamed protein product [Rotaria sp. Silwood2]|nr:unnamed protein product [Rotaria sp. Silwood2]CAF4149512.1 unnamed protein product [Rotaria sp. Silwood2]CAF4247715.1 unnamed protein product [Rotaria sp. Silwood2]CAF4275108.1 unnamed protein product [Rotaria sp. Silwood2]
MKKKETFNDLEADMSSNISRDSNKKMRKRKQFDSLMKFHLTKSNSNDVLRSSEDELFIHHRKIPVTKLHSSRYLRLWNYFQHIFCFSLICICIIFCFVLTYANIELKKEVQSLSSRINEIEKKFLNVELNKILPAIEQMKTRVNFLENWNFSFVYNQLQKLKVQMLLNNNNVISSNREKIEHKLTHFPKTTNDLHNLNQETEIRLENMTDKSIMKWYEQFNSLRLQSKYQNTRIDKTSGAIN